MAEFTLLGFSVVRAVAEHGSFTAAASALGYTQSAVSRQVAAMETAAGMPLFERGARGTRPTSAGSRLLVHATEALEHAQAAARELTSLRATARGRLRVGAFPTALAALIPRSLREYAASHPQVDVVLREGTSPTQLRRLHTGASDIAVITSPLTGELDAAGQIVTPLLDDHLLLAVARSHRLATRPSVEVDELIGEAWITGSTSADESLLGAWPGTEWKPRIAFVVRDWTAKLGLVAGGLGVALVPSLAASSVRPDVALVRVRAEPLRARKVLMAMPDGEPPGRIVTDFASTLRRAGAALAHEVEQRVTGG